MSNLELVRYDAMCLAIEACHKVDEVKEIRDRALAFEKYAAQALNTEAERKACDVRLRAERRAGELLKEMKECGTRATVHDGGASRTGRLDTPTLSELGISRDQASKWQKLAEVPEYQFETALRDPATKPSTKGIIKAASSDPVPKIDPDALWVWGRLRDFERDRITDRKPNDLFSSMTDTMQQDVSRIVPSVIAWLKELKRSKSNGSK